MRFPDVKTGRSTETAQALSKGSRSLFCVLIPSLVSAHAFTRCLVLWSEPLSTGVEDILSMEQKSVRGGVDNATPRHGDVEYGAAARDWGAQGFHLVALKGAALVVLVWEKYNMVVLGGSAAGGYAGQPLRACCASFAKGLAPPALCRWSRGPGVCP